MDGCTDLSDWRTRSKLKVPPSQSAATAADVYKVECFDDRNRIYIFELQNFQFKIQKTTKYSKKFNLWIQSFFEL